MKKNKSVKAMLSILSLLLVSCTTTNSFSKEGRLRGMVTNFRGDGVADYSIVDADKKIVATTDERGFFDIDLSSSGKKQFTGFKESWERTDLDFSKVPRNRLYLLQIRNADELKEELEASISQNNFHLAEESLGRCENGVIKEKELILYKSIIAYKKGDFLEAKNLLKGIKESSCKEEEGLGLRQYGNLLESKTQAINLEKGEESE